jgi:hypothetical protein
MDYGVYDLGGGPHGGGFDDLADADPGATLVEIRLYADKNYVHGLLYRFDDGRVYAHGLMAPQGGESFVLEDGETLIEIGADVHKMGSSLHGKTQIAGLTLTTDKRTVHLGPGGDRHSKLDLRGVDGVRKIIGFMGRADEVIYALSVAFTS